MAPPGHSEGAFMGRRVEGENAKTRAGGEYAQARAKIEEAGICPFCEEHLPKHHGKPILFSNAHWIVTENAWPYEGTRHQFVLVARENTEGAGFLSSEAWEALGSAYRRLVSDYQLEGATLLLRTGRTEYPGVPLPHCMGRLFAGGPPPGE